MTIPGGPARAALFVTCIVDQLYPEVGESVVRVLRRLGVEVSFPPDQTCCGQPAFNSGFWDDAKPAARRLISSLGGEPYVVAPSGSCASMVRVFYSELFRDEPETLAEARRLAPRVYEFSEFVHDVLGVADLGLLRRPDGERESRKITYHEGCHLRRELGVVGQPRALLRSLPGVELAEMDQVDVCCGFGGAFSVRYPEVSEAMLQDKIDRIRATGAETLVSCDAGCLMHLSGGMERQGAGVRTLHLAQMLDESLAGQREA